MKKPTITLMIPDNPEVQHLQERFGITDMVIGNLYSLITLSNFGEFVFSDPQDLIICAGEKPALRAIPVYSDIDGSHKVYRPVYCGDDTPFVPVEKLGDAAQPYVTIIEKLEGRIYFGYAIVEFNAQEQSEL